MIRERWVRNCVRIEVQKTSGSTIYMHVAVIQVMECV